MAHLEDMIASTRSALRVAQQLQLEYDAVGWQIQEPSYAKTRHITFHLLNATAALGRLVEHVEHVQPEADGSSVENDFDNALAANGRISATLLFHALQLATLSQADVGEELLRLYRANAERFARDSPFAEISI